MLFSDKYTTQDKITADKEGLEAKKAVVTNDTFALAETIEHLKNALLAAVRATIK